MNRRKFLFGVGTAVVAAPAITAAFIDEAEAISAEPHTVLEYRGVPIAYGDTPRSLRAMIDGQNEINMRRSLALQYCREGRFDHYSDALYYEGEQWKGFR